MKTLGRSYLLALVLINSTLFAAPCFAGREGVLGRLANLLSSKVAKPTLQGTNHAVPAFAQARARNRFSSNPVKIAVVEQLVNVRDSSLKSRITLDRFLFRKNINELKILKKDFPTEYNQNKEFLLNHGTGVTSLIAGDLEGIEIFPVSAVYSYETLRDVCKKGVSLVNISRVDFLTAKVVGLAELMREFPQVLFIAGADNRGTDNDVYATFPSSFRFPNLVAVGSSALNYGDGQQQLTSWSNYGKNTVHLAAQGENILVRGGIGGGYRLVGGTSFSAPIVTNTCAKMKLIAPSLTVEEIVAILEKSVTQSPHLKDKLKWEGVLNAEAALKLAAEKAVREGSLTQCSH